MDSRITVQKRNIPVYHNPLLSQSIESGRVYFSLVFLLFGMVAPIVPSPIVNQNGNNMRARSFCHTRSSFDHYGDESIESCQWSETALHDAEFGLRKSEFV